MKKCKSCQTDIDAKAKKCPHCQTDQRNWFVRHPILSVILGLIVFGIIGSAMGGSKTSTSSSRSSTAESTSETKQEVKVAGLNETVEDGDLSFTVTKVDQAKTLGNSFTKKDAQGTFYVVTLKIDNKGKKTATFDSSMAKLVDDQGREFERSIEGGTAKGLAQGNVDLFLQQIQPSLAVTGDLVFDLPADVQNPTLILKGSMFSSGVKVALE